MYEASAERRNTIAFGISHGVPCRRIGILGATVLSRSPTNRRTIDESINPGRIVLTRMLSRACETAAERPSPSSAALVASYEICELLRIAASHETFTIARPPPI